MLDFGGQIASVGRKGNRALPEIGQALEETWMARSKSKHRRFRMKIRQHWKKRRERKKLAEKNAPNPKPKK